MDNRTEKALSDLLASKKYSDICPDTVRNAFMEQTKRHGKLKDADKAARAHLHAITGAFITPDELKSARKAIREWMEGDEDAFFRAIFNHSSTRERAEIAAELYARAFSACEKIETILDLACGINPIFLGKMGYTNVTGLDIHAGCADLINECALFFGWKTRARAQDLILNPPCEEADITLMMKLLPVLETQKAGAAKALLSSVRSRYMLVTFPTQTLGGKKVGMEKHYTEWFEKIIPENLTVIDRFVIGNELAYTLERK
ncbi:MAG: Rmt family 16S rRNA (guanine(1405)-N(7))-methyltransferase [Clostridia bacterium]|nr:Rmt family 16S rRNA (guanine(1405)-N(7))-methyltransferase [Clostridia bacterium]